MHLRIHYSVDVAYSVLGTVKDFIFVFTLHLGARCGLSLWLMHLCNSRTQHLTWLSSEFKRCVVCGAPKNKTNEQLWASGWGRSVGPVQDMRALQTILVKSTHARPAGSDAVPCSPLTVSRHHAPFHARTTAESRWGNALPSRTIWPTNLHHDAANAMSQRGTCANASNRSTYRVGLGQKSSQLSPARRHSINAHLDIINCMLRADLSWSCVHARQPENHDTTG